MATREENLKKINEELEKLDDEQLEKIAGGRRMYIDDSVTEKDLNTIKDSIKVFRVP
ncbi:MAG: hypothetical protein IKN16_11525 [Selenomonadaceae bacterium]|nr:hypothetical protein [Selenomonadaceae bacterium]